MFGSVGDDSKLIIWDTRKNDQPVKALDNAHQGDINCLSFNRFNENLVATGIQHQCRTTLISKGYQEQDRKFREAPAVSERARPLLRKANQSSREL